MEHAVPLLGTNLIVFEPFIAQLSFDPLAELFMMVGELVGVAAFRR
jgi:hypothetical protein